MNLKKEKRFKDRYFFSLKNLANVLLIIALIAQSIKHANWHYFGFDVIIIIIIGVVYVYIHKWGKARSKNTHIPIGEKNENLHWYLVLITLVAIKMLMINYEINI